MNVFRGRTTSIPRRTEFETRSEVLSCGHAKLENEARRVEGREAGNILKLFLTNGPEVENVLSLVVFIFQMVGSNWSIFVTER